MRLTSRTFGRGRQICALHVSEHSLVFM